MKSLLLIFGLLVTAPALAAAPIHRANPYTGSVSLEPLANGKYEFRMDAFSGEGLEGNNAFPDLFVAGQHYSISGILDCEFGKDPSVSFRCHTPLTEKNRKLHAQRISDSPTPGQVVVERDIAVDFYTLEGTLVTTEDVSGTRIEAVVETNVLDSALDLSLTQRFGL
jgi:hypothetical protein